ncbi:hypothetical protein BGZ73_000582 [Actinomortierella ambigua]|nr:hypothetical protein BGZ73_000582 [Actinomortierella ambigua]
MPHKLPPLPPIRDLIRVYGLSAKQKFSQNFILDRNVTDAIVQRAKVSPEDDLVVEVGPGPGLLTRSVLDAGPKRVVVVEKDERFVPALQQLVEASNQRLGIAMGDMLQLQHSKIFELAAQLNASAEPLNDHNAQVRLLGNLPFGVASPLLIQWLKMMSLRQGLFQGSNKATMTLMFQKEVAQTICAPPNHPQRGRLSVMAQSICDVKLVYKLNASVFVPKPMVDAAVVHFEPKATPLVSEDVTRFFFNKKRKTMANNTNRLAKAMPEVVPLLDQWQAEGKWDMSSPSLVNKSLPASAVLHHTKPADTVKPAELFGSAKKAILIGVPGAFTPGCSKTHVPSYLEHYSELKAKGVDLIGCVSVNDAFVMDAWGKDLGVQDKIVMLADPQGKMVKELGLDFDASAALGGYRAKRFTLVLEPNNTGLSVTLAENVLKEL